VNQIHFEGFFEAEGAAGGHEFESPGASNGAGKALCAASAGENAEIHFGKADLAALFFGDADVAGEGNFETATDSVAVKGSDDKFGSLLETAKRFVGVEAEIVFELRVGLCEHRDAGARGEKLFASAAHDDNVDGLVHAGLEDGRVELLHHVVGISVGGWIVHFKDGDAIFDAVFDEFFGCHAGSGCHLFSPAVSPSETSPKPCAT
jgi:hypothetical protein